MANRLYPVEPTRDRKCMAHYRAEDGQDYIFIFRPNQLAEALRAPGRMVVATDGKFNWQDANVVCDIIRELGEYDD